MVLAEYLALPEDKRRAPVTITDDNGLPCAIAYFDGTFLLPATSNVGKEVEIEGGRIGKIVWDGGMPDPKGGFTKGTLLDEFRSRDSLHMLREMYGKGAGGDESGASEGDSPEGPDQESSEETAGTDAIQYGTDDDT